MNKYKALFLIVVAVVFFDQYSKYLAVKYLVYPQKYETEKACKKDRNTCYYKCLQKTTAQGGSLEGCQQNCRKTERLCNKGHAQLVAQWKRDFRDLKKSKYCSKVERWSSTSDATCVVIKGLYNYRYQPNPGAAWGIFKDYPPWFRRPFFITITIIAIFFIFYLFAFRLEKEHKLMLLALSFILGGALGNFIDRLRLDYVVDFIDWSIPYGDWFGWLVSSWKGKGSYHWPTFNIADVAISGGVIFIAIELLFYTPLHEPTDEEDDDNGKTSETETTSPTVPAPELKAQEKSSEAQSSSEDKEDPTPVDEPPEEPAVESPSDDSTPSSKTEESTLSTAQAIPEPDTTQKTTSATESSSLEKQDGVEPKAPNPEMPSKQEETTKEQPKESSETEVLESTEENKTDQ